MDVRLFCFTRTEQAAQRIGVARSQKVVPPSSESKPFSVQSLGEQRLRGRPGPVIDAHGEGRGNPSP